MVEVRPNYGTVHSSVQYRTGYPHRSRRSGVHAGPSSGGLMASRSNDDKDKRQPLWPLPGIGACVNHHRRQCKRPVLSNNDRAARHALCKCLYQSHGQGWLLLVLYWSCFTKTVCRPWVRNHSVTAPSCNRGTHMQRNSVARLHPQRLSRRVGVIPCEGKQDAVALRTRHR